MQKNKKEKVIVADVPKATFFTKLKNRKLVPVAVIYIIISCFTVQMASVAIANLMILGDVLHLATIAVIVGFPISLLLLWTYTSNPNNRKQSLFAIFTAALIPILIVSGITSYFHFNSFTSATNEWPLMSKEGLRISHTFTEKSIAILPYENISNNNKEKYFTNAFQQSLTKHISRINGLETVSPTSVFHYQDTIKNIQKIAAELGVEYLLEGGVQRANNKIRINVQLVAVKTNSLLWSETYIRDLTAKNIFAVQSEITLTVADKLQVILSKKEQQTLQYVPTENLQALDYYFKVLGGGFGNTAIEKRIDYLLRAIKLDPNFSLAHAKLGEIYHSRIWLHGFDSETQIDKSLPYLQKAFQLDPNSIDIWLVRGLIERLTGNYEEAVEAYKKAIEIEPSNANAYYHYAISLNWDFDNPIEALAAINKAIKLRPDSMEFYVLSTQLLTKIGKAEEIPIIWKNLNNRYPNREHVQVYIAKYYQDSGKYDLAIKSWRKAHSLNGKKPSTINNIIYIYQMLEQPIEEKLWLQRGLALESEYSIAYQLSLFTLQGKLAEAHQLWMKEYKKSKLPSNPFNDKAFIDLTQSEFQQGTYEAIMQRTKLLAADFFATGNIPWEDDYLVYFGLTTIAKIWHKQGKKVKANQLFKKILPTIQSLYPHDNMTIYVLAIIGEKRRAKDILNSNFNAAEIKNVKIDDPVIQTLLSEKRINKWNKNHKRWQTKMRKSITNMKQQGLLTALPNSSLPDPK